jgi:hypothetical protein
MLGGMLRKRSERTVPMRQSKPALALFVALLGAVAFSEGIARAQRSYQPPNDELPNPYEEAQSFGTLPPGWKQFQFFSGIDVDANDHVWIFMRCPGGSCSGTTLDTVVEFDKSGKILRSWGAGLFNQAHSLDVDKDGNIWSTHRSRMARARRYSSSLPPESC